MSYRQLVTPNLDPMIIVNGAPLPDWLGWCMGYVASAFDIFGNPSAHSGWVTSQFKHPDRELPTGVYVPLWFDYYANLDGTGVKNWGHVVIYKDGTIWSSPISHKPYADTYSSIEEVERDYDVTYVGWSEDISGVRVVELITQGDDMITDDITKYLYGAYLGRDPNGGELDSWRGRSTNTLVLTLVQSQEAHDYYNTVQAALKGKVTATPLKPGTYIVS